MQRDRVQGNRLHHASSSSHSGQSCQAVFKVSQCPHIFSSDYRFKFDLNSTQRLGFIVPSELDLHATKALPPRLQQDLKLGGTTIYLPLLPAVANQLGKGTDFADLDPLVLLFLNKLQRLEVSVVTPCVY